MPIRILHIIPTLDRGGAEKQLCLLAAGLPREQFDVHVACLTRGGSRQTNLDNAGIPYTIIGKRWKFDPLAFRRLKNAVEDLKPDIVHTWLFAANCYGRAAAKAAGVPTIFAAERCVDPWKRSWQFVIDRHQASYTERITTNTVAVRDFYAQRGIMPEKFKIIPNGISHSQASQHTKTQLLSDLNLPSNTRLIVAVGRLWPQKNYKHLMWAMCILKEIRQDVHLLIVGDGPQQWRLKRYSRQVRIEDHVHFLGERNDVESLLPCCEMLVNSSNYEGQSNAILEAMAAGLPVVATDIAGTRDLIQHKSTGFLTPVGDRAELARRVNQLLDDEELRTRMGHAGNKRALEEFSVEAMIKSYSKLYSEFI